MVAGTVSAAVADACTATVGALVGCSSVGVSVGGTFGRVAATVDTGLADGTPAELVGLAATPPVGGVGNNGAVSSIRRQPVSVSDRTTRITIRLTSLITANRLLAQKNATPRIIPDFSVV